MKPKRSLAKKLLKNSFFWSGVAGVSILAILMYLAVFSPFAQVAAVEARGTKTVEARDVEEMTRRLFPKNFVFAQTQSIFLLPVQNIEQNLKNTFPQFKKVQVQRNWFQRKAVIAIEERAGKAVWCQGSGKCFLVDEDGVLFLEIGPQNALYRLLSENYEELDLGDSIGDVSSLRSLLSMYEELDRENFLEEQGFSFLSFELGSGEKLEGTTSEGWKIFFTLQKDIKWQSQKLRAVLKEKVARDKRKTLEYIDVRFGDQAYVK